MPKRVNLRVLIFRSDDRYVAQCLEYDIAAQGETLDEVRYQFEYAVVGRIAAAQELGSDPFDLPAAPPHFHELWDRSATLEAREPALDFPAGLLPSLEVRSPIGRLSPAEK
jgi:hypothetical protein